MSMTLLYIIIAWESGVLVSHSTVMIASRDCLLEVVFNNRKLTLKTMTVVKGQQINLRPSMSENV